MYRLIAQVGGETGQRELVVLSKYHSTALDMLNISLRWLLASPLSEWIRAVKLIKSMYLWASIKTSITRSSIYKVYLVMFLICVSPVGV